MRITAKVDYAVRAAIELARAYPTDDSRPVPLTRQAIAEAQEIPSKFLEHILADLKRSQIVGSVRGADGGYWLHRPPAEITMADIIRAAQQEPGKLTIASSGNGSSTHLTAVMMQRLGRFSLTHVPYKGSGPAFSDLISGHVDMMFSGLPAVSEYIKGHKLKAVAIAAARRSPFAPEVPTMGEAGLAGFESFISQGLFAPAGTPADTVARINAAVGQVLGTPDMARRLAQLKAEFQPGSAADYRQWLDGQSETWARLIRDAGIKID